MCFRGLLFDFHSIGQLYEIVIRPNIQFVDIFDKWKHIVLRLTHVGSCQPFFQQSDKCLLVDDILIELKNSLGQMRKA